MEFRFDCKESLGCDDNGFAILEGSYQNRIVPGYILYVKEILNSMGEASSKAQELNTTITSADKFFSSNHRIFIKAEENKVLGFIKVGDKKLFLRDRNFNYHEVNTLCVLDFYVHESTQRKGIGKQLFDFMLNFEKKDPRELAYDRPSPKLLNFLKKYFGLNDFIKQNNNYVVFDEFFLLLSNNANNLTYDNDTNRAIKNLTSPSYNNNNNNMNNNINNNFNNNMNTNINNNMNINNSYNNSANFARTSPSIQLNNNNLNRYNNIDNNYRGNNNISKSMSNIGQNVIYNNTFNNNVINKDVYSHPNNGFRDYYLNNKDTIAYDNIYSKRKINLINDYLSSKKLSPYEYVSQQIGIEENSIDNSNRRLNELMNKVSDIRMENKYSQDQLFNKRNQYATIFDDKKLVEYNYRQQMNNINDQNNNITNNDFNNSQINHIVNGVKSPLILQHYSPFSNLGKVYTTVLPTSSSAYGSYFKNADINQREQSPNKIYY